MSDTTINELIALFVRDLNIDAANIGPDTPLFEDGLELDSFTVVDLVARIETNFGIQLSDTDFRPENFVSVRALANVISGYQTAKTGA